MQKAAVFPRKLTAIPDAVILLLVAALIYGVVRLGQELRADYHPLTQIDLSIHALPNYVLLSGMRGIAAYALSLAFTLIVGYVAAHSKKAERFIIPALDVLQSIPVLGFLPGLVLGLVALFPRSNVGLELAAIIMIFTGQVWNMTFSFYASLKSVPVEWREASTVMGLNWKQVLNQVELPFAAVNLTWNSVMSMAGGWFFLTACEAFTLGDSEYRLPGIGAYMAVAMAKGDKQAIIYGVVAMTLLIVAIDFFMWRPILAWVQRFRLEDVPGAAPAEPLMRIVIRESRLVRWFKLIWRRYRFEHREQQALEALVESVDAEQVRELAPVRESLPAVLRVANERILAPVRSNLRSKEWAKKWTGISINLIGWAIVAGMILGGWELIQMVIAIRWPVWVVLIRNCFWSLVRVVVAVGLSTIWTVPFGIWVGTSHRRIRFFQPIIQVLASFPAPMLYPLALTVLFFLRIRFDIGSMFLLMLGVQWYVLFNVLAGALRIPRDLNFALELMGTGVWDRWRTLYLPSVFPALVTGWVTAAGGAWNATMVAEIIPYQGETLQTSGLGATISMAAATKNFPLLAASLVLMVIIVIVLNRTFWARLYQLASTRYRLDA